MLKRYDGGRVTPNCGVFTGIWHPADQPADIASLVASPQISARTADSRQPHRLSVQRFLTQRAGWAFLQGVLGDDPEIPLLFFLSEHTCWTRPHSQAFARGQARRCGARHSVDHISWVVTVTVSGSEEEISIRNTLANLAIWYSPLSCKEVTCLLCQRAAGPKTVFSFEGDGVPALFPTLSMYTALPQLTVCTTDLAGSVWVEE